MLRNYLTVALRNVRKYKGYSFINITGLAIGLTCFILIILFVLDEFSYDRHHTYADDIYRVEVDIRTTQGFQQTALSPSAWAPALVADYPEVVSAVRLKPPNQKWMVGRDALQFYEKGVAFADSSVFDVFTIPLVRGNPETALDAPFRMVISEAAAAKYFGTEDPMGQTIALDSQYEFEITGIMEDMPRSGHFYFDFLPSISTLSQVPIYGNTNFLDLQFPVMYTYVRLRGDFPASTLEEKMPAFVERYVAAQFPLSDIGFEVNVYLRPLTDIHLHSRRENEIEPNGDIATVYIFLAVALFILVIASINFMNLATARSASRAKEVGMRKVVGAQRGHLILQFLGESVLLGG
ncbi:MAG: ABC transporter permease, partial [Rhodothermales bacterium]